MKKYTYLFLATLLIVSCNNESVTEQEDQACDNGTFVGDVILSNQQEVDDFGALCYSKIEGILRIGKLYETDDITDLSALSSLKDVQEVLFINGKNLTSLHGLEGVVKVGQLQIFRCDKLLTLEGLNNLETVNYEPSPENSGYLHISENNSLISLEGLSKLRHVSSGMDVGYCPNLQQIDALQNLSYVGYAGAYYVGNIMLSDFCGLKNLFSNGTYEIDDISITDNAYNPTVQDIIDGNCSQ